jgi:hypothetical protein
MITAVTTDKKKASSTSIFCKLTTTSFSYKKLSGNSGGQHKQVSLFLLMK